MLQFLQQHNEFIASLPHYCVRGAYAFEQSFGNGLQHLVADEMSEGIIHLFEPIQIQKKHGDMAALTFRLVEHDPDGKISYFRNSGTFLLRHGKWQAITWQATRVADPAK